jgi:phosphoglycerate dehydrogenase-like enzyme
MPRIAGLTDLGPTLAQEGYALALQEDLGATFGFDAASVVAIAAGEPKLGAREFAALPNLKIVARFGVGVDNIDLVAARERGLVVTTAPARSHRAVAEMVMAHVFALSKNLVAQTLALRAGTWKRDLGGDVQGKTLGIVGLGHVGKETAKLALALGMRVVAFSRTRDEAFLASHAVSLASFREVLSGSDALSVHLPLTTETRKIIDREALALLPRGALFINTARGAIVDDQALFDALETGRLGGVGLDVFTDEPPFQNDVLARLLSHPRVVATPHVATFTLKSHYQVGRTVFDNIVAVMKGELDRLQGRIV